MNLVAGHYNVPGWNVVDVTDRRNAFAAKFIPGANQMNSTALVARNWAITPCVTQGQ